MGVKAHVQGRQAKCQWASNLSNRHVPMTSPSVKFLTGPHAHPIFASLERCEALSANGLTLLVTCVLTCASLSKTACMRPCQKGKHLQLAAVNKYRNGQNMATNVPSVAQGCEALTPQDPPAWPAKQLLQPQHARIGSEGFRCTPSHLGSLRCLMHLEQHEFNLEAPSWIGCCPQTRLPQEMA